MVFVFGKCDFRESRRENRDHIFSGPYIYAIMYSDSFNQDY